MNVVERLRGVDWGRYPVHVAVVHGSALRINNPRDIDVLIVPSRPMSIDEEAELMKEIETATGIEADLQIINAEDPDCVLLQRALETGRILYLSGSEGAWALAKLISLCYDYELMKRKLRYTETVLESALRHRSSRSSQWMRQCFAR